MVAQHQGAYITLETPSSFAIYSKSVGNQRMQNLLLISILPLFDHFVWCIHLCAFGHRCEHSLVQTVFAEFCIRQKLQRNNLILSTFDNDSFISKLQ